MDFVAFTFGSWNVPNLLAIPIAIPGAILFYYLSKKMWKVFKSF